MGVFICGDVHVDTLVSRTQNRSSTLAPVHPAAPRAYRKYLLLSSSPQDKAKETGELPSGEEEGPAEAKALAIIQRSRWNPSHRTQMLLGSASLFQ